MAALVVGWVEGGAAGTEVNWAQVSKDFGSVTTEVSSLKSAFQAAREKKAREQEAAAAQPVARQALTPQSERRAKNRVTP